MNILIDCGTHFGEGMKALIEKYKMTDENWKIYTFEPNYETFRSTQDKDFGMKNIYFNSEAVWIYDGEIEFNAETPPNSEENTGAASSLIPLEDWQPKTLHNQGIGDFQSSYLVSCVSLSRLIGKITANGHDKVVVKLDIEGAEFAVLEDLIETETIKLIDTLYVEFHEWAMPSKTRWSKWWLIIRMKWAHPGLKIRKWL